MYIIHHRRLGVKLILTTDFTDFRRFNGFGLRRHKGTGGKGRVNILGQAGQVLGLEDRAKMDRIQGI